MPSSPGEAKNGGSGASAAPNVDGTPDESAAAANAANAAAAPSCPICMADMGPADVSYPLLCPTGCGYNFCADCAQHLVDSSRDDYEEASDGNRHVKIRLQCPQCRGDLSTTIHETLLLRRHCATADLKSVPDSELSAAELRLKHEGAATAAQLALAHKVYRTAAEKLGNGSGSALDGDGIAERRTGTAIINSINGTTGEEALEVDEHTESVDPLPIDVTLFCGLEFAMTEDEQRYVTEKMTAGNAEQLAQAAQILAGISELSLKGVTPSMRCQNARNKATSPRAGAANTQAGQAARQLQQHRQPAPKLRSGRSSAVAVGRALAMGRTDDDRAASLREAEIKAHRRMHPLPSRMPRYATLDVFDPNDYARRVPLTFADDTWDGSIADAFARVQIGRGGSVMKRQLSMSTEEGVQHVLVAGGGSEHETHISAPAGRVVVRNSQGQAGRLGIQKGDVVTHVNGEVFGGTAEELTELIGRIWAEGEERTFNIVVNAEACTAEALRLRSLIL